MSSSYSTKKQCDNCKGFDPAGRWPCYCSQFPSRRGRAKLSKDNTLIIEKIHRAKKAKPEKNQRRKNKRRKKHSKKRQRTRENKQTTTIKGKKKQKMIDLTVKISAEEEEELAKTKTIETVAKRGECNCCSIEQISKDLVHCRAGHSFCSNCINHTFEACVIGQGQVDFKCFSMDEPCDSGFSSIVLGSVLNKNLVATHAQMTITKALENEVCYYLLFCVHF